MSTLKKTRNTSLIYSQLEASLSYILKLCINTTGTTKDKATERIIHAPIRKKRK